jgi:hypothetical protein
VAFTAAQKQKMRDYLGSASVYRDMQHRLEGAMDVVGADAEASAQVIVWLTRLQEIDDALFVNAGTSAGYTYGTIAQVDEVKFHPITKDSNVATSANIGMQDQGCILINRIARNLGVWDFLPAGDYFGRGGRRNNELPLG